MDGKSFPLDNPVDPPASQTNQRIGVVASLFLAALSAWGCYATGSQLARLHRNGQVAQGTVVRIHTGAKGLRSAVVRYNTKRGEEVEARDTHSIPFTAPNEVGDQVTLRYDPSAPQEVFIERAGWEWLNTGIFGLGAVMLLGLAVAFGRGNSDRSDRG